MLSIDKLSAADRRTLSELQLSKLVRHAREFSPLLREARYAVGAAEQDISAAKGARLPQVSVSTSSSVRGGAAATSSDGRPYLGLTATVPVYDWGRIDAQIRGREATREATSARLTQQANQIATEAVNNCLEYTKQRALLAAAGNYRQNVERLVDMLTKISDADPGRRGELVQSRSRLLQAMQQRENIQSRVREFRVRLDRLLGPDRTGLCDGVGPSLLARPDLEQLRSGVNMHPQVRALQSEYDAALRVIDQISASRKPQVQASATYGPALPGVSDQYMQSFTLGVSVPLYDGNILKSNEKAAVERASAAAERVEQASRQVDSDYRERYETSTSNLRRANEYTSLIEVNDRVRKDFFVQWSALGRRTLYELLAIEQEQFTLQQGYFTSLFDGMIGVATILGNAGLLVSAVD